MIKHWPFSKLILHKVILKYRPRHISVKQNAKKKENKEPWRVKRLLPYDFAHLEELKRAIAMLCLESALRKSCTHKMQASFTSKVGHLLAAGFPLSVINAVAKLILQKIKLGAQRVGAKVQQYKWKPEKIPYSHKVSQNLKKVAYRHDIPFVFSAPNKLSKLCPCVLRK